MDGWQKIVSIYVDDDDLDCIEDDNDDDSDDDSDDDDDGSDDDDEDDEWCLVMGLVTGLTASSSRCYRRKCDGWVSHISLSMRIMRRSVVGVKNV